ncbi:hypothetical protein TNIN_343151 [Trichonephila inaurata madagascariensis]|uniref:Uncharacterized protein n=1 Tax=Trichonephila inaurata madagascariensis TaxID=2747483 RepID=A0A8X6ML40_9ARAC|nr:hypothetical protein TNIN_343151 [Trichonephila inaurata madagascariensis]
MHVNRKVKPSNGGNGPTRSIWTAEISQRLEQKGLTVCLWTLHLWHGMQHRIHLAMSFNMDGQTKRSWMRRFVARILGWERLWKERNTSKRSSSGT